MKKRDRTRASEAIRSITQGVRAADNSPENDEFMKHSFNDNRSSLQSGTSHQRQDTSVKEVGLRGPTIHKKTIHEEGSRSDEETLQKSIRFREDPSYDSEQEPSEKKRQEKFGCMNRSSIKKGDLKYKKNPPSPSSNSFFSTSSRTSNHSGSRGTSGGRSPDSQKTRSSSSCIPRRPSPAQNIINSNLLKAHHDMDRSPRRSISSDVIQVDSSQPVPTTRISSDALSDEKTKRSKLKRLFGSRK